VIKSPQSLEILLICGDRRDRAVLRRWLRSFSTETPTLHAYQGAWEDQEFGVLASAEAGPPAQKYRVLHT